jgi:hypothetical protein
MKRSGKEVLFTGSRGVIEQIIGLTIFVAVDFVPDGEIYLDEAAIAKEGIVGCS